jgi:hypothetical protein
MTGQLGNQMFQYALYRKFLELGRKVKIDMSYYDQRPEHNGVTFFNLNFPVASLKEVKKMKDEQRDYLSRARRKFFGKKQSIFSEIEAPSLNYKPEVLNLRKAYVDGYWQTEKYFKDIRHILLNEFKFPTSENPKNKNVLDRINSTLSVSIHIRRGDYVGTADFPVVTQRYLFSAIRYFEQKLDHPVFFIFSDDIEWAKHNITQERAVFVDWNSESEKYYDMFLMSRCKHNIIANSSYSWWGAWLNTYKGKKVIAPSVWLNHRKTPDVYCKGWKVLTT